MHGAWVRVLLVVFLSPVIMHPFRDGAPFLLLVETPPTGGSKQIYILMD